MESVWNQAWTRRVRQSRSLKLLIVLERLEQASALPEIGSQIPIDLLIQELRSEVEFLRSQLQEQLAAKDRQIAEKDQQLERLLTDIEGWREQVRYKELQLAQAQERVIELPFPEEHQPTEQEAELSRPDTVQAPASGNALQRFWRWFVGG
jgi:ribosome assembly protein YihI (activator of Der GTPase)